MCNPPEPADLDELTPLSARSRGGRQRCVLFSGELTLIRRMCNFGVGIIAEVESDGLEAPLPGPVSSQLYRLKFLLFLRATLVRSASPRNESLFFSFPLNYSIRIKPGFAT